MVGSLDGRGIIGDFATPDELLDLIRRRQLDLELSNAELEQICGFVIGQVDKYLGPTRAKSPNLHSLHLMMDALGVSGALWIDAAKMERFSKVRSRSGKRMAQYANTENGRISKLAIKRARPVVIKEMGRKGGEAYAKKLTPTQRKQVGKYLAKHRWGD